MKRLEANVGDLIYFAMWKTPYKIRARNERFIICTQPFFGKVSYTIIDLKRNERGTDNLIFGAGAYKTEEDIATAMRLLQQHCDEEINPPNGSVSIESMEVSYRNCVELDVVKVKHL